MPTLKKPATIDDYLARLPEDQRAALEALRQVIRSVAPGAEERISYGICALHLDRMLVGFGARRGHCAFYLLSNRTVRDHAVALAAYDTSAGTIRFQPSAPLPKTLIRRLVKARLAENAEEPLAARRKTRGGPGRGRIAG
jgi:uncharacterized protein YdhG (YjbR/CyaY superfamily)